MKIRMLLLTLLFPFFGFCQIESASSWDENYKLISVLDLLKNEQYYSDSIDNGLIKDKSSYVRFDGVKFEATYIGYYKPADTLDLECMRKVLLICEISDEIINEVNYSFLFKVNGNFMWLLIQDSLVNDFQEEVKTNDNVMLYCAFFNEKTEKMKLNNLFLISEFSVVLSMR